MADFPDPDFTFQRGPWGENSTMLAVALASIGADVNKHRDTVRGEAKGNRVDMSSQVLDESGQCLGCGATLLAACVQAFSLMRASADRYEAAAPKLAEVQDAAQREEAALRTMMREDTAASMREYMMRKDETAQLRDRRNAAKAALEADDSRIAETLRSAVASIPTPVMSILPQSAGGPRVSSPGNPNPTPSTPSPASSPSAAPGSAPGSVPGTKSSSGPGSLSDKPTTPSAVPAAQQPQQPQQQPGQQPQQQPQPQAHPAAASPSLSKPGEDKKRDPLSDLSRGPSPAALGAIGAVPAAVSPAAAAPSGPTGTSVNGLKTAADVTSRPGPATNLSAAHGIQNAKATAAGPGAPMGRGGMPMMPMMGGPGAANSGKERKVVTQSEEQAALNGLRAQLEAVRGGTLLRRDTDPTLPQSPLP